MTPTFKSLSERSGLFVCSSVASDIVHKGALAIMPLTLTRAIVTFESHPELTDRLITRPFVVHVKPNVLPIGKYSAYI